MAQQCVTASEPAASSSSLHDASPTGSLNIQSVVYGDLEIDPWYPSFYREEVLRSKPPIPRLHVCPTCFKYTQSVPAYLAHRVVCENNELPPGEVIYDSSPHSIYEVDGEDHPLLAQNLSLFSKLFIESKSVCFDVHTFIYYLLVHESLPDFTNSHAGEYTIVGFFSKEKLSWDNNNLACILVFPPWQRAGFGQMLMAASYAMSKKEGRLGGPERPLSKPGKDSYEQYWSRAIAEYLLSKRNRQRVTINEISEETYILQEDVLSTMLQVGAVSAKRGDEFIFSKNSLREWIKAKKIDTAPPIRPEGFRSTSWLAATGSEDDGAIASEDAEEDVEEEEGDSET